MHSHAQVREILLTKSTMNPETGCREWNGSLTSTGYGRLHFEGRRCTAHRAAWALANGPLTPDQHLLHRCDNPRCINPVHLSIGTNRDNIEDKCRKGRAGKKLTLETARQVRQMLEDRVPQRWIADHFGIHQSCVSTIANGKSWVRAFAEKH